MGYGVVDVAGPGRLKYVECGLARAPTGAEIGARLAALAETLDEVIAEFSPAVVAVEKAFFGRSSSSALRLGEARGMVLLLAVRRSLPVFEYAPAKVKRAAVGHGRATKDDVQRRMAMLCGLKRLPESDAADALAIAICHAQHMVGVAPVLGSTP